MIIWFKFNSNDENGTSLYNYASKQYVGALMNGSTIKTVQARLGLVV
jgi:hypothetical protein